MPQIYIYGSGDLHEVTRDRDALIKERPLYQLDDFRDAG